LIFREWSGRVDEFFRILAAELRFSRAATKMGGSARHCRDNETPPAAVTTGGINPFSKELRHVHSYAQRPRAASENCIATDRISSRSAGRHQEAKTTSHLVFTGEAGQEAAARWLELDAQFAETERELALVRDRVLDVVRPWHEETCSRRRTHEPTVVVETATGALRVSFQHRYAKLALDREEHLRQVLGDDFERLDGEP
jgi:hypothetical protein